MRRGRGSQLEQVLGVLAALESARNGLTLAEIASEVELSERTVRRYLDDVAARYFPVVSVRGGDRRVRWRFADGFAAVPKLTLRLDEALALARLRSVAAALVLPPWRGPVDGLLGRIERVVPREFRARIDRLVERFGVAPAAATASLARSTHDVFEAAVTEQRTLIVRYRSADGRKSVRRFDPWLVYAAEGTAYAYGFDHRHGEGRSLALDRVVAANATEQRFERPPGFSAASFVRTVHRGWETKRRVPVVLRARGRAATLLVDRPEVPEQSVEPLAGQEVRVRFEAADTPALRARLLSFGAEVVVEAPEALRKAVAAELAAAARAYEVVVPRPRGAVRAGRRDASSKKIATGERR